MIVRQYQESLNEKTSGYDAEVAMTAEDSAVSDMTRKPQTHVNLTPLTSAEASLSTARRDSLQSQSQRAFSHFF